MCARIVSGILVLCVALLCGQPFTWAQTSQQEEITEGVYEITLNTRDRTVITVDRLFRDRDLDPHAIYRVTTDGYLAFDERNWVKSIDFKVFDVPVIQMPEYKEFTETLVAINKQIWSIKLVLRSYDELSLRLMNLCNNRKFLSLQDIDSNIVQQLTIYRNLLLLKSLVVNSLNTFIRERSCVDKFDEYRKQLNSATSRLTELCKNYQRLRRNALQTIESKPTESSKEKTGKGVGAPAAPISGKPTKPK